MTITEANRHQLHQALITALGEEEAATLMEHLPPVGWADVATKTDIDNLRIATKTDIDNLRVATKTDINSLRVATKTDINSLRVATKAEIENLRAVMDARFDATAARFDTKISDLRTEIATQFKEAQRWQLTALACAVAVLGALMKLL